MTHLFLGNCQFILSGGSTGQAFRGWMVIRRELCRHCYMLYFNMHALFIFVLFQCIHEAWFQPCIYIDADYVCKEIPKDYPAGLTSLIFFVSGLGEISVPMFNSTNLASVNSLTMAHQDITAIGPQTFDKFQNLKNLNLRDNHLSQVSSDWFSHHAALETLRLSNNKITTLDHNSLDGLSNLLMLNLSQNQIHTITQSSFLSLRKLVLLDLSNNQLTHLSADLFLPLNGTKIRLNGNPWNCSCSVKDFAKFLRGLQNASLLENEMSVCCDSPHALKGVPVWQVRECETLTTMDPTTTTSHTNASLATGSPATVIVTKPLTIGHSTLIILIVVLCALVLVICVLSVLYHKKRERKHLQAVKPSSEKSEIIQACETTAKSNRKVKSEIANKTQIATREILLRTNQMVAGDERISQIYHIYSSGTYETREPIKRVNSAGPILCRTEKFAKQPEAEAATEEVGVRNEYYNGWMTSEKQKDNLNMNIEELEKLEDGKNIPNEENEQFSNTTDTLESPMEGLQQENEDTDKRVIAGTSVDKDVPQNVVEIDVLEDLNELTVAAGSSQYIPQAKHVTPQPEETDEKLPYLTIGADPENQTTVVDQNTAKSTSGPLRPIRRVLTWPPTAVQWKKQWAQNQQFLNVFPKLIFGNGCRHEIGPFHSSISPATLPTTPQFNALEFLPEIAAPMEDVRVAIDEDTYSLESPTQKFQHFTAQERFTNANISLREDGRIITNEETWRSGLESAIFSDLYSKNSPIEESEVCSELFSIFNPSFGGSKSKPAVREEINNKDYMEEMQSVKTRNHQSKQVASELQKQSRRVEKAAPRADRDQRRGQVCNSSDSRAPPSGGSPKDDSLLLGNEYTFIDLLHEVVENHGRWTRDRWRQTQKNKHKLKQSR